MTYTNIGKLMKQKPEHDDPRVDKMTPKIILKSERVFQPKYEDVASKYNGIHKKQQPYDCCLS